MVYYDHSIAAIDTGEDKTEDRRYDSGILQKGTPVGSVEVRQIWQTLRKRTPRSVMEGEIPKGKAVHSAADSRGPRLFYVTIVAM